MSVPHSTRCSRKWSHWPRWFKCSRCRSSLQAETASLRSELTATNTIVAAQGEVIASIAAELDGVNGTLTDISELTGDTTIVVIVVNALRRLTAQLASSVTVLDGAVANQTIAISEMESLTGSSLLVSTVAGLTSTTSTLTSTVTAISDLTGSSTIVATVAGLTDSITVLAANLSTLQTLETSTAQTLTNLSETVTPQVALLNAAITAAETKLGHEIKSVNSTLTSELVALSLLTADEMSVVNATLATEIGTVSTAITDKINAVNATLTSEIGALSIFTDTHISALQPRASMDEAAVASVNSTLTASVAAVKSSLSKYVLMSVLTSTLLNYLNGSAIITGTATATATVTVGPYTWCWFQGYTNDQDDSFGDWWVKLVTDGGVGKRYFEVYNSTLDSGSYTFYSCV